MRRRITIENKTHWRTDHVRRFIVRLAREVLPENTKPRLRVVISYTRGGGRSYSSGCAVVGGTWMKVRLARERPDKVDFAHVIAHELGHIRGLTHRDMRGAARYQRVGRWRELYAWAGELPLEKQPPRRKTRPAGAERARQGLENARTKVRQWQTRLKRAQTHLGKWRRKLRYYERRIAALEGAAPSERKDEESRDGGESA